MEDVSLTVLLVSSGLFPPPIVTALFIFFARWFKLVPPVVNYLAASLLVLMSLFAGGMALSLIAGGDVAGFETLQWAAALMTTWTVAAYSLLFYLWKWAFSDWGSPTEPTENTTKNLTGFPSSPNSPSGHQGTKERSEVREMKNQQRIMQIKLLFTLPGGIAGGLICWIVLGRPEILIYPGVWFALVIVANVLLGQLAERRFVKQADHTPRFEFLVRFAGWYIDLFRNK